MEEDNQKVKVHTTRRKTTFEETMINLKSGKARLNAFMNEDKMKVMCKVVDLELAMRRWLCDL